MKGIKVYYDENLAANTAKAAAAQRKNFIRQAFADVATSANLQSRTRNDGAGLAKKPTRLGVSYRSIKPEAKAAVTNSGASTSSLSSLAATGSAHSLASSSRPSTVGSVVLPMITGTARAERAKAETHGDPWRARELPQGSARLQQKQSQPNPHSPAINLPFVRMSRGPDSKSVPSVPSEDSTKVAVVPRSGSQVLPLDSPLDQKMDMSDCPETAAYLKDIMSYMRQSEIRHRPRPNYITRMSDVNSKMREILIDWLVTVHLKFDLQQETLFLTVHILDRFLECRRAVSRNKLQLIGCTAMLIAAKYEEIYPPKVDDFVYISDETCTKEQILAMESIMLNALKFSLTVPSPLRFVECYLEVAAHSTHTDILRQTVGYFMEQTLQHIKFLQYLPSMVAAAALCLAVNTTPTLQRVCQYSEKELTACMQDLHYVLSREVACFVCTSFLCDSRRRQAPKYRAVRKKYSYKQYGQVGLQRPRLPAGIAALPHATGQRD